MKYYSINYSTGKEIGRTFPQSERSIHHSSDEILLPYLWKKNSEIPENIIFPVPILVNSAKITDLISHSGFYSFSLLISQKLKSLLLENSIISDLFQFETIVKTKNGDLKYWGIVPLYSRDEFIDFSNTIIQLQKVDLSEKYIVPVKNFEEYKAFLKKELGINYIKILKISFNEVEKPDFFCINHINLSNGFIVSENLKNKILDSKFTGITFDEFT
jgi:hypothetical protein